MRTTSLIPSSRNNPQIHSQWVKMTTLKINTDLGTRSVAPNGQICCCALSLGLLSLPYAPSSNPSHQGRGKSGRLHGAAVSHPFRGATDLSVLRSVLYWIRRTVHYLDGTPYHVVLGAS